MSRRAPGLLIVVLAVAAAGATRAAPTPAVDRGLTLRAGSGDSITAPMVGTAVAVRVTGIVARTRLTQVFVNPTTEWVEGIYAFPLPDGAAIDALRMKVGDRVLAGVVREKQLAAAVYQEAKAQGHRTSLLELLRPGVFTTSVANLGPGETVEITIELQQVVEYGRGGFALRFPLVVPPRYAPRGRDALPIAAPVAGPAAPSFSLRIDLEPGFPLGRIASPSHQVTVARDDRAHRYSVELAADVVPADADFQLEWAPAVGQEPSAVYFSEEVGGERYALLMVMPPDAPRAAAARLPRETVFVIDTSGSMEGTSIEQARQALLRGLDRLAPTDAFNVIRFSSTASALFPASVPADPASLERARSWVRDLGAEGGTEMLPALQLALATPAGARRELLRQVIFATDGQVSDEAELLQFLSRNLGDSRLYAVAIGAAPNAAFLRRAASLGRGTLTAISSADQVTIGMDDLFERLAAPLLRDVAVEWGDAEAEAWPARIQDLYLGEPIVVTARLHGEAGPAVVAGTRGDERWRDEISEAHEVRGAGLDELWASRKVQALLDSLTAGGDGGEVAREVTALGLAHRLVTPYTSFVVMEEAAARPAQVAPESYRIPGAVARGAVPRPASADPDLDSHGVEDAITVTAESPLLDERRISTGATVSETELEKIPTARDPWALLQSTPGVLTDRINVGGSESGQQDRHVGPGSAMGQTTWSVDGVVITDMAALGASPSYFDFDAFEEMQVTTGGADAANATGGVTLNMVTKRGTNEWRGSGRFYLVGDGWTSAADLSQADLGRPGPWNRGVASPAGSAQAASAQGDRVVRAEEHGVELGGPVVRDRLWTWGAYGRQRVDRQALGGLAASTEIETVNLKSNSQVTASNSAVLFAFDGGRHAIGLDAGPFRRQESACGESPRGGTPTAAKLEDTEIFSSDLYLTGLGSIVDGGFELAPRGGTDRSAFRDRQDVWHNSYRLLRTERPQRQLKADASLFFSNGRLSHELKLGAGYRTAVDRSRSGWGGAGYALSVDDFGGYDLLAAGRAASLDVTDQYASAFVEDTLSVGAVTAKLGLRYDEQRGRFGPRAVGANPVLPALLPAAGSGGGDAGFAWRSLVPRLGLTYALGAERKTLLRASYARFADQLGAAATAQLDPLALPGYVYLLVSDPAAAAGLVTRGDVVDRNGDGVIDGGDGLGFGAAYDPIGRGVLQSNGVDPGLHAPMTDELVVGAEHALLPELTVGLDLTYRRLTGLLERELLVFDGDPYSPDNLATIGRRHTRADYEPVTVIRPGGLPDGQDSTYTYWQLRPGVASRGGTYLENGDRRQEYLGASLTMTKRLASRWMLRGNVTWSDWRWRVPDGEREDPTRVLGGGFDGEPVLAGPSGGPGEKTAVFVNSGWSYDLDGLFQVAPTQRWGFDVAAAVSGREGYPLPYYERLGFRQRQGIPGFTDLQVVGNDDFRLADVHLLDAGIDKEIAARGLGLTLAIDCFNLLDERYVLQRDLRLGVGADAADPQAPASSFVTEVIAPRTFRIGVQIHFR